MEMKCALNFRIETLAANCSTVPFTSITYLDKFFRGLKICRFPMSKSLIASLALLTQDLARKAYKLLETTRERLLILSKILEYTGE